MSLKRLTKRRRSSTIIKTKRRYIKKNSRKNSRKNIYNRKTKRKNNRRKTRNYRKQKGGYIGDDEDVAIVKELLGEIATDETIKDKLKKYIKSESKGLGLMPNINKRQGAVAYVIDQILKNRADEAVSGRARARPRYIPGHSGIQNVGNTCWFNSLVQILARTPDFMLLVQGYIDDVKSDRDIIDKEVYHLDFFTSFKIFADKLIDNQLGRPVNRGEIQAFEVPAQRVMKHSEHVEMGGNPQRDPHEFLLALINMIPSGQYKSPFLTMFQYDMKIWWQCTNRECVNHTPYIHAVRTVQSGDVILEAGGRESGMSREGASNPDDFPKTVKELLMETYHPRYEAPAECPQRYEMKVRNNLTGQEITGLPIGTYGELKSYVEQGISEYFKRSDDWNTLSETLADFTELSESDKLSLELLKRGYGEQPGSIGTWKKQEWDQDPVPLRPPEFKIAQEMYLKDLSQEDIQRIRDIKNKQIDKSKLDNLKHRLTLWKDTNIVPADTSNSSIILVVTYDLVNLQPIKNRVSQPVVYIIDESSYTVLSQIKPHNVEGIGVSTSITRFGRDNIPTNIQMVLNASHFGIILEKYIDVTPIFESGGGDGDGDDGGDDDKIIYELYALSCTGRVGGHYWAICKTDDGWYKYNDDTVTKMKEDELIGQIIGGPPMKPRIRAPALQWARVLFYRKIENPAAEILAQAVEPTVEGHLGEAASKAASKAAASKAASKAAGRAAAPAGASLGHTTGEDLDSFPNFYFQVGDKKLSEDEGKGVEKRYMNDVDEQLLGRFDFVEIDRNTITFTGNAENFREFFGRKTEFCYDQLEKRHNYIQWLFPTTTVSQFNIPGSKGPEYHGPEVLTEGETIMITGSDDAKHSILESFKMILDFWGFELQPPASDGASPTITLHWDTERGDNYYWSKLGDHNHSRISRVLQCLQECGLNEYAVTFFNALWDGKYVTKELESLPDNLFISGEMYWARRVWGETWSDVKSTYSERARAPAPTRAVAARARAPAAPAPLPSNINRVDVTINLQSNGGILNMKLSWGLNGTPIVIVNDNNSPSVAERGLLVWGIVDTNEPIKLANIDKLKKHIKNTEKTLTLVCYKDTNKRWSEVVVDKSLQQELREHWNIQLIQSIDQSHGLVVKPH